MQIAKLTFHKQEESFGILQQNGEGGTGHVGQGWISTWTWITVGFKVHV
jgi:hypothetical protein